MKHASHPRLFKPYPELAEATRGPQPYDVRDSRDVPRAPADGFVDLVGRRIFVPHAPGSRSTCRHELGHVAWSPPTWPTTEYPTIVFLAIEDARINLGLAHLCIPVVVEARGRARVAHYAAEDVYFERYAEYILRSIAAIGTSVAGVLREAGQAGPPIVLEATARLCSRVEGALRACAERRARPEAALASALELGREVARELAALGLRVPENAANLFAEPERAVAGKSNKNQGSGLSGTLDIVTAPLGVKLCADGRGSRHCRPSEEGSVVRYLHRQVVDGRIFRRSARRPGGTVLVDTSGSMSFSAADIDRIVRATSSAMRIAIYSGRGAQGELRIVAQGGRRAAPEDLATFARGNVVDEPCLAWLARQRPPRVWISDGGVTGVDDQPSSELKARCERIVAAAGITRVKGPDEAAAALRRGAPRARAWTTPAQRAALA